MERLERKHHSIRVNDKIWNPFSQACKDAGHDNKSVGIERVLQYMLQNRDTLVYVMSDESSI